MLTILFYNFILFSSTFFVWLSEKGKGRRERYLFLTIAFLLVFIPSAIRYDIGTDYVNYVRIFETGTYINYQYKEPLFYFINSVLSGIDAHFQWFMVVTSFIFSAVAFKAYPQRNAWIFHLFFIFTLWFFSFNGIRQAVALSFSILSIYYFLNNRVWLFIFLNLVGMLFHNSVFLILILGLISLIPLHRYLKSHIFPFIAISSIVFIYLKPTIVFDIMENFLRLVGMVKYANYFQSQTHFIEHYGSGLGILVKILFSIYLLLNTKYLIELNKKNWLVVLMIYIYTVALVLASQIVIFGRMADIFKISLIFGVYFLYKIDKNRLLNKLVLIIFILFMLISFIKASIGKETSYADPKRNPYQTIFEVN